MGAIAERAGITRAVLYDHFDSKQALYLALLEERNAAFLSHVGARITGSGDPRERMRETIDTVFAFAEQEPASWRLLFGGDVSGDDEPARARRRVHDSSWGRWRRCSRPTPRRPASSLPARAGDRRDADRRPARRRRVARSSPGVERDLLVDAAMELLWTGLGNLG